ncbi:hypothetical protein [Neobacillus sp. D3-1R]|uniref:hypothetical protein n=1 Tax=Neobacillus sp. D3-1R TaxID=3445778 RepID=UPI003F9F2B75
MKKELLFAFMAFFLMSLTAITGVYATNNDETKKTTLLNKQVDITGDGKKEEIIIYGIPNNKDEKVYKKIHLTIKTANGKNLEKKYEYGLDPKLKLIDFNHDGVKDVFLTIQRSESGEGNGGVKDYYLYSFKDMIFVELPLPETMEIEGQFTNGYKAKISIPDTNKKVVFDLMFKKDQYDNLGMYQNGKLNEPTELIILPYGKLTPFITKDNHFGLSEMQQISGVSDSDTIAFVDSKWFYKNGKWMLYETKIRGVRK